MNRPLNAAEREIDRALLAPAIAAVMDAAPLGWGYRRLAVLTDPVAGDKIWNGVPTDLPQEWAREVGGAARDIAYSAHSLPTARAAARLADAADYLVGAYTSGRSRLACECLATIMAAAAVYHLGEG